MFHRKSPRLTQFDYSDKNYYYVTICTHEKKCIFGNVNALNCYGKIAEEELLEIPKHFKNVKLDKYMVMPNHIHAIIILDDDYNEGGSRPSPTIGVCEKTPSLTTVLGLYKSGVSRRIHETAPNLQVWQRSFYDHIIRNEQSYLGIWQYIDENPLKWELDEYYQK